MTRFRRQLNQDDGLVIALSMLWLVAVNLRTGLIGVGPVLPRLTDDLDLTKTAGSFLVALPTALMGLAALPGGRMADRLGPRTTISLGLLMVALGGGLRALAGNYAFLVGLTILFGLGIGLTQPALPRLSRALTPHRIGFTTGLYASGFFLGAVIPALLTVPLLLGDSDDAWRKPIAIWGGLAFLSLLIWLVLLSHWRTSELSRQAEEFSETAKSNWTPWRDRKAWIVASIFAGQGLAYYLMVAWLPSVYEEAEVNETTATLLYAVFTLTTFPAMVGLPPLSDRLGSRRIPVVCSACTFLAGGLGLAFALEAPILQWVWPALAAFGVAGLFGMALLMPVDVSPPGHTGAAAGMVLGVGYVGSATGPVIGGAIRDATGSFEDALLLLPIIGLCLIAVAWFSPQPGEATKSVRN